MVERPTKVAFTSFRGGNADIWVMNANGSGQANLTGDSAVDDGAVWSPDGSKLAYTRGQGRNAEVYVVDADGSDKTALTNNLAFDGEPAWSPDGRRIAFTSDRDGNAEIYVMKADGTNQTRLTEQRHVRTGSPHGLRISGRSRSRRSARATWTCSS